MINLDTSGSLVMNARYREGAMGIIMTSKKLAFRQTPKIPWGRLVQQVDCQVLALSSSSLMSTILNMTLPTHWLYIGSVSSASWVKDFGFGQQFIRHAQGRATGVAIWIQCPCYL